MGRLLEVKNLSVRFRVDGATIRAVDGVSYYVDEGEIVAFVGESGCGKSVTQYSVLQLIPRPPGEIVAGEVWFDGTDLLRYSADSREMRAVRGGKIGIVFQEPMTSLNPVLTVGSQIAEAVTLHLGLSKKEARRRAVELMKLVGIPDAEQRVDDYPHQFSGGMRQRIMIAMALSCNPKLLIADEATTALDVTTQAQVLELLRDVVKKTQTALVIVTHNLGIVARYAERVYVMYAGEIVESGPTRDIFGRPRHPYTIGLLKAVPRLDDPKDRKLATIDGLPPDLSRKPEVCAFLPRCPFATDECRVRPAPRLKEVGAGHYAACYVLPAEAIWTDGRSAQTSVSARTGGADGGWRIEVRDRQEGDGRFMIDGEMLPEPVPLVEVRDLRMYFPVRRGLLQRKVAELKAVDGVSFRIRKGETLGLVGESGCGKTTVARCVLRMYEPTGGAVLFRGSDITRTPVGRLRPLRRNMSMIFQDPFGSLDPRQTVGNIVGEPLKIHKLVRSRSEYEDRLAELFRLVGLDPDLRNRMPHEFSGGQRQRVGIARALASQPEFIVCDEPISALDVSIQAQIINLLEELQEKLGLTYLFIAHDLSVVRHISDRVAVMYLGKIVEIADWRQLYDDPRHPYTKMLLSAVPIPDPVAEQKRERIEIRGEVPSLLRRPKGCGFVNRCPLATKECEEVDPELREVDSGHHVACWKV